MRELIVRQKQGEKQIAYLEDGILKEYYQEKENYKRLEGNIYVGKVVNVLPGMQAAFVDIGEETNTFLHIRDVLPKKSSITGNKEEKLEQYKIKDYIKPNQMLLVQVKKDSTKIKGARVSTHIQIPARFVVLLPENDFITISQKIEEDTEKNRLIKMVEQIKKDRKIGIIIRTAAEGRGEDEIQKDIEHAMKKLEEIERKFDKEKEQPCPKILQKTDTILEKLLLDISDHQLDKIIVNSTTLQKEVEERLKKIQNNSNISIEYQANGLENRYEIEKQIDKIELRKIWLKCGGFITIDKTEALTAIDVNSRKIYRKRKFRSNRCKSQ